MTKEEILAMKPGEELDALTLTEVLGYPKPDFVPEHSLGLFLTGNPFRHNGWTSIHRYSNDDKQEWMPDPVSTNISDAWQVFEKMREMEDGHGNLLFCCLGIFSDYNDIWEISWSYSDLSIYNDGHKKHRSHCYDDLPEAICKSALIATMPVRGDRK